MPFLSFTARGGGDDYIYVDDFYVHGYDWYDQNSLSGGTGNDTIIGGYSNDDIYGESGNDWLEGGSLADYLDGGLGSDRMFGGSGGDTYVVDSIGDYVEDVVDNGEYDDWGWYYDADDQVYASISYALDSLIENLYLTGSSAINGTGNDSSNYIAGNSAANVLQGLGGSDTMEGSGGNDTLNGGILADYLYGGDGNDSLDGGTGVDAMYGGAGDDVYYASLTSDVVVEETIGTAGGADTVYAVNTFTLGANVETLALVGTTNANGTGNAGLNNLYGNSLVNTLRGLGGADTFRSGNGAAIVIGGTGNDLYQYLTVVGSTPGARDIIRAGDGAVAFEAAGAALGDRFDLSLIDANTQASGVQDFVFGTAAGRGRLWALNSGSNTLIRGNTDSDSAAEFEVLIEDGTVLASAYTSADFLV